jgi:hypothetical protein
VLDDEDKPASETRQPGARDDAVKLEGAGKLSVSAILAQAAAATLKGSGNLSFVVERLRVRCQRLVSDIKRGRPSPAQFFRDEAQRRGNCLRR